MTATATAATWMPTMATDGASLALVLIGPSKVSNNNGKDRDKHMTGHRHGSSSVVNAKGEGQRKRCKCCKNC